ncbi:MAG TPA: 50S ribosomal protein L15 [Candidatus Eisenbacteria bacterium]|nr:50S ribosomal protein L15 [Candidatus Eisenbacteria bacterium]
MDLSRLRPAPGSTRPIKRVGRGPGSGHGKTAGRGHKGKGARSGGNVKPGYEGGQMPLQRRLPKRGFRPVRRSVFAVVNLGQLAEFAAGSTVGPEELRAHGLVRGKLPVKCLAEGALERALTVRAHAFSQKARERIEAAGGRVEVLG